MRELTEQQILGLEIFFIGMIASAVLVTGWVSWLVLSRLYKGQR